MLAVNLIISKPQKTVNKQRSNFYRVQKLFQKNLLYITMRAEYLKDACQAKFHAAYAGNLLQIHAKQKEDPLTPPPEEKIEDAIMTIRRRSPPQAGFPNLQIFTMHPGMPMPK
jgi:hypothetical protein